MICDFLSERSISMHCEYLNKMKLQYSILEKSYPCIAERKMTEIQKMRVPYKDEILALRSEIAAHELFFDSFGAKNQTSALIKSSYSSEASFLYEIYEEGRKKGNCFAFVSRTNRGVETVFGAPGEIFKIKNPVLAIDLYEHSYFLDYGFDREAYIKNMLSYLSLNKVV